MKYIIMCGGEYTSWNEPRQLIEYKGETLVGRTIRLLREQGVDDIVISSNNPVFEQFGVPVLKHDNEFVCHFYDNYEGYWFSAFYPTDEPACYVFGDVYFSPEAIKKIVETETDDIQFFASKPPFSLSYPKPWVEPFAFKVVNQKHLREACEECKRLDKEGAFDRKPISWELWYVITGTDPRQDSNHLKGKAGEYVAINDYTCDFDYPQELEKRPELVSVIIPFKDSQKWIRRCADSLLKQRGIEAIFVNDNSKDNGVEILKEYGDRFIVIDNERKAGVSGARNTGLDHASADWITFLDADDEILPGAWKIYQRMIKTGYPFWQANHKRHYAEKNITRIKYANDAGTITLDKLEFWRCWCMVWNKLIRRDIIGDIRFDEKVQYGEDEVFILDCLTKHDGIKHAERSALTCMRHFDNKKSLAHVKDERMLFKQSDALVRFIKRHKENPTARLAACKVLSEHWRSKTYTGIISMGGDQKSRP